MPTGRSVSCSAVCSPKIETSRPIGMTAQAAKAGITESTGAMKKTALSARTGQMSSLNASFSPSASDWSSPNGPFQFGPGRCCMRPTTRRSNQIMNSVISMSITKTTTTLISDQPERVVREQGLGVPRRGTGFTPTSRQCWYRR